jgi:hypothetical protein
VPALQVPAVAAEVVEVDHMVVDRALLLLMELDLVAMVVGKVAVKLLPVH